MEPPRPPLDVRAGAGQVRPHRDLGSLGDGGRPGLPLGEPPGLELVGELGDAGAREAFGAVFRDLAQGGTG